MQTPELSAALAALAAALPADCGFALIVVRPPADDQKRQCHICQHNLDTDARILGADCLKANDGTQIAAEARH